MRPEMGFFKRKIAGRSVKVLIRKQGHGKARWARIIIGGGGGRADRVTNYGLRPARTTAHPAERPSSSPPSPRHKPHTPACALKATPSFGQRAAPHASACGFQCHCQAEPAGPQVRRMDRLIELGRGRLVRLGHPRKLTCWNHEVNPSGHLSDNAPLSPERLRTPAILLCSSRWFPASPLRPSASVAHSPPPLRSTSHRPSGSPRTHRMPAAPSRPHRLQ